MQAHAGSDFAPPRTEDRAKLGEETEEEAETETHLVLVAPGAHTLIPRYLASFGFPAALVGEHPTRKRTRPGALKSVRMFVDPRPAEGVYAALGMGWVGVGTAGDEEEKEDGSTDPQSRESTAHAQAEAYFTFPFPGATNPPHDPSTPPTKTTTVTPPPDPHADPAYVTHGPLAGVGAVVLRALRAGMPVWARGGDIGLLGGEWVFEVTVGAEAAPSLRCTYAHRMQSARGHAGVDRVFAAAGLRVRVQGPEAEESDIARPKSAITPRGTLKKKDSRGIARSASVDVLGMNTSAPPSVAHTRVPDAATVPRSMSTPPTSSSSRGMSMFTRFAGPKGGRAPASGRAARSLDLSREQLPRSVSTPPGSRVGVIWEATESDERPRQPALPASLSASSSRPWALAAAGSCASLASASSDSLSFSSKAAERAHAKVASSASASSWEVRVYEPGYVSGDEGDDESERPAFPRREGYATSSEGSSEDASEYGYGYGAPPGEDVLMRARAQSLARLRARKEMRRGGGQCVASVDGQA
ncbi:hypothetical protein B0H11DRAFT_2040503 [Mycena galericulata]|nr:hypothetical protein B0H11DRAFT_2040503 [Mycena galericulata]